MKKLLYTFIAISFVTSALLAQDAADKNVRFGVFVRGTPSWYSMTSNNYYSKGGAVFGMGFGLNLEFRITDVVAFQTGIGGDFDGGKINYTYSPTLFNPIYTNYILNNTPALVEIKGTSPSDYNAGYKTGQYTGHALLSRQIHTTYVTIPLLLKMKTKEISGLKYFVNFGGHIDVLAGATTTDNTTDGTTLTTYKGLSMYKDCIPVRVGLNAGLGAEYRLAGTTSLFLSFNFVNSFISTVKATSVYNYTGTGTTNGYSSFNYAAQKLNANGVQINIGILF
jgi:hypothetical protein